MRRRSSWPLLWLTVLAFSLAAVISGPANAAALGFGKPVFVDRTLGGGEPSVAYAARSGLLVYTSHEGTTHLFSSAIPGAPAESGGFLGNYHNQVNIWTSSDNGLKWKLVPFGTSTNPFATGFSDPDLTQDASGNIYNTGIDLANDAVFSSQNGGKTWPTGTAQCHEGDRPWLAGGKANEVFVSTDADGPGHIVVHSTDAGASCSSNAIPDNGSVPKSAKMFAGDNYAGDGKIFYDHRRGNLVEGVVYTDPNTSKVVGVGFGILKNASQAFSNPKASFVDIPVAKTSFYSHWPSVAIDSKGNYYLVWNTDNRSHKTRNGCPGTYDGSESSGSLPPVNAYTPLANRVMMAVSTDGGLKWGRPRTVAYAPGHWLLWPWAVAGSAGRVGVVWYQYNKVVDPDCAPANSNLVVMAAEISGATGSRWHEQVVNASGRPIHSGTTCAGGTECAAVNVVTKEDRRLGDYFTVNTDRRGCLIIATGDTTLTDSVTGMTSPISHPLFLHQDSGPSLTAGQCGRVSQRRSGSGHRSHSRRGSQSGGGSHSTGRSHRRHHRSASRRPKRRRRSRGFTG